MPVTIDVRKAEDQQVDKVRFSNEFHLEDNGNGSRRLVNKSGVVVVTLSKNEVDNLPKAIEVADKVWG